MDILIRFGFTIEEIKNMMDANENINNVSDKDMYELIEILNKAGCLDNHIKNIFICNPFYLTRDINEINNLIKKLYELGFNNLFVLFDSNPYILNFSDKEIENIYNRKLSEGLKKEEVIDYINYNIII